MGLRVKDGGESESQSVMDWIGVEPLVGQHHSTRKRADFHRVLDGRKGEEVGNEMFRLIRGGAKATTGAASHTLNRDDQP